MLKPDNKKINVVFFGSPEFAIPSLLELNQNGNYKILAVITQSDKKFGKNQTLTPTPIGLLAEKLQIPTYKPNSQAELQEILKKTQVDFFVVIAYGMILKKEVLAIPKIACVNVHASLLPKYRGASPIHQSLLNGDRETGISFMKMNEKMDQGDIYLIKKIPIEKNQKFKELSEKMSQESGKVLPHLLEDIYKGSMRANPQNHKNASYCKKIKKEDGKIDWEKSAREIQNKIRAFQIWPGAYTYFGGKSLKILEADFLEIAEQKHPAGTILQDEEKNVFIQCGKGFLRLIKVQIEGKNAISINDFLNGNLQKLKILKKFD